MKSHEHSPDQDAELRRVLQHYDPAGEVLPSASSRLEMLISERLAFHPQHDSYVEPFGVFMLPRILNRQLSWPATMAGTMALGLALGLLMSMLHEAPEQTYPTVQSYTITTAMTGPWHAFTE